MATERTNMNIDGVVIQFTEDKEHPQISGVIVSEQNIVAAGGNAPTGNVNGCLGGMFSGVI